MKPTLSEALRDAAGNTTDNSLCYLLHEAASALEAASGTNIQPAPAPVEPFARTGPDGLIHLSREGEAALIAEGARLAAACKPAPWPFPVDERANGLQAPAPVERACEPTCGICGDPMARYGCGITCGRPLPVLAPACADGADEAHLEGEAYELREAWNDKIGEPSAVKWMAVAERARTLHAQGGVSEATIDALAHEVGFDMRYTATDATLRVAHVAAIIRKHLAASGASVVVDRSVYERLCSAAEYRKGIEAERDSLAAKLAEAEKENTDWNASFDLYHAAETRGCKMWQDAGPNRQMTLPDKGKLTAWLLDRLDTAQSDLATARAEAERLRGELDHKSECLERMVRSYNGAEAELARLRTAPPAVNVTDCEAVLEDLRGQAFTIGALQAIAASLRKHTRSVDAEEVARAIESATGCDAEEAGVTAVDVLRVLGAQLAPPRAAFVPDREKVLDAVSAQYERGPGACGRAALTELARQRAEWEKGGAS